MRKPNIIFILADDISAEDLGCYGNAGIHTPNIDNLAATGIRFNNGFVTSASCAPSRGSIMTGRWPHANAMPELKAHLQPNNEELESFVASLDNMAEQMQKAGYHTIQSGKWHLGGLYSWNTPTGHFKTFFDSAEPVNLNQDGGAYDWVKLLRERPKDRPFFCWYATFDAHRPWDGRTGQHGRDDVRVPPYMPDVTSEEEPYDSRRDLAAYYDEIARWDRYVGDVVEELKRQGVYENTLIVLLADNGRPFVRSKVHVHDSGMRVPFIAHWPAGIKNPGSVTQSLVSSIDLAPTFTELAGQPVNGTSFQGRSLVPLLTGDPNAAHHKAIFTERNHHIWEGHERGVRTDKFLYIRNRRPQIQRRGSNKEDDLSMFILRDQVGGVDEMPDAYAWFFKECPPEELFDVEQDPNMVVNLATNPKYAETMKTMRDTLAKWETQTGDTAPDNLTKHFWEDTRQKKQLPMKEQQSRVGEAPGWSYWKDKSPEQTRIEAAETRERF